MAYVPGCSADVFISYAHDDNWDGWVTRLKDKLTEKLNPFLAGRAEVWFDKRRLQTGDYFKDEIQEKLRNTPVFVAVVSPSYLDSEFCVLHELNWFQDQRGKDIFQLLKVPLDEDQDVPLPETQYTVLHDATDGHPLAGEPLDKALDTVVAAITQRLRDLWDDCPKKVYLAQFLSEDTKTRWDLLKKGLHTAGCAVLPKGVLPPRVPDARIRDWIERARLSIQFGGVPDDLARRQLQIARGTSRPMLVQPEPPTPDKLPEFIAQVEALLASGRPPAVYLIYDYHTDRVPIAIFRDIIGPKTGCEVFEPRGRRSLSQRPARGEPRRSALPRRCPRGLAQLSGAILAAGGRASRFPPHR